MGHERVYQLSIEIDKLTNSIVNRLSGEIFQTTVSTVAVNELNTVNRKNQWKFNWKKELLFAGRMVYKLCKKK